MPVTTYTIYGDVGDLVGEDFDARRTKIWFDTNVPNGEAIVAGTQIRLGNKKVTVNADGTFLQAGFVGSDSDDTNIDGTLQYRAHVDYAPSAGRERKVWTSSWFELTADNNLATAQATTYAPAGFVSAAITQIQGYLDEAQELLEQQEEVAGLTGEDTAVGYLVRTPGAAANTASRQGQVNVQDHGATGDGVTDDTAALNTLINSLKPAVGVGGAKLYFPPGEYVISDTLLFNRWSGLIEGAGLGNSPKYTAGPGRATVIRWAGPTGKAMFRLRDYRHIRIENIRFEGNDTTPPDFAIESWNGGSDTAGTAASLVVDNVAIGKWPWSTQGTNKGLVGVGVGFTGTNTNNDQFRLRDVTITGCSTGVSLPNTQSIWGTADNLTISTASVAGIATSASITGINWAFDNCAIDIQINSTAKVNVVGHYSERSARILDFTGLGSASILGGNWKLAAPMTTSSRFISHTTAIAQAGVSLYNVSISTSLSPHPKLYVRAFGGAGIGNPGRLAMHECITTMTMSDFDVASTSGNALHVHLEMGALFHHRRYTGAATMGTIEQFAVNGALNLPAYATGSRPTASVVGVGAQVFDSTLSKPIWSTGSGWVDAAGTAV